MPAMSTLERDLVDAAVSLPSGSSLVNFYDPASDAGTPFLTSAAARVTALRQHVVTARGSSLVLVGEAPGWRGARQSGVAFTDALQVGADGTRERSARVVRETLQDLGLGAETLLWNAVTLHPHEPGRPLSNRRPTSAELLRGLPALELAVTERRIVCVGVSASQAVSALLGVHVPIADDTESRHRAARIRHPSYGGVAEFRRQLAEVVARWGYWSGQ